MESVKKIEDIDTLQLNKIIGKPTISASTISFTGKNNILYCENNVKLTNANLVFGGNNSIVYLSSTNSNYPLNLQIFSDSIVYIGKDNNVNFPVNINVQEHQNVIIGDEGILGSNATIRTSDAHPIFNLKSKKRVNDSKSVYIGDHVWIGHQAYVGKGSIIGSGAILDANTYTRSVVLGSNKMYSGNPVTLIEEDVFFTSTYVGNFTEEDSLIVEDYASNAFNYERKAEETLNPIQIDEILSTFNVYEKIEFIQKLFIQNKKHDRFSI